MTGKHLLVTCDYNPFPIAEKLFKLLTFWGKALPTSESKGRKDMSEQNRDNTQKANNNWAICKVVKKLHIIKATLLKCSIRLITD